MMEQKRLLIVDDEQGIRLSLRGILEDEGHLVFEAGSAEEGLAFLENDSVDLMFLDIWLPGMDGLAIATQLASDEKLSSIPIVVTTALEQSRPMFEKIPSVRHFTPKPFTLAELLKIVGSILH